MLGRDEDTAPTLLVQGVCRWDNVGFWPHAGARCVQTHARSCVALGLCAAKASFAEQERGYPTSPAAKAASHDRVQLYFKKRGNGCKLHQGKSRLDVRNSFFLKEW